MWVTRTQCVGVQAVGKAHRARQSSGLSGSGRERGTIAPSKANLVLPVSYLE